MTAREMLERDLSMLEKNINWNKGKAEEYKEELKTAKGTRRADIENLIWKCNQLIESEEREIIKLQNITLLDEYYFGKVKKDRYITCPTYERALKRKAW